MVNAFMINYKIKMGGPYNHSDYGYQKLFRAIYGYTQVVTKSSGKKYVYHRPGVLSNIPFVKKGKNEVIVNKEGFSKLIDYLKTGKNPAHKWEQKGDWTATYSMYDIDLSEEDVSKSIEKLIKNTLVLSPTGHNKKLMDVLEDLDKGLLYDDNLLRMYLRTIKQIQSNSWYSYSLKNNFVKRFDLLSKLIKERV